MSERKTRSTAHRLVETAHLLGAGVWLAGLIMGGVVAAIIFTTTPELEPRLGMFGAYTGDHANLLAGYIQNRVFLAGDALQFVGGALCLGTLVTLIAVFRHPVRRVVGALRVVSVLGAITLLSYSLMILSPRMAGNLDTFYEHARAGENETAEIAREAFLADHPAATRTHSALAALVLIVLVSGAWSVSGPPVTDRPARERARQAGKAA